MIEITNLTKGYQGRTVLDGVTFGCTPGTVTGFLGPNGAGKSTTLRILTGLSTPDSGRALIDGVDYVDLHNPGRKVGLLLDASAQHAGRTGREALAMSALQLGLSRSRVDQIVATVGLTPAESRRRIRGYSLGMRQRLGLAHALLGEPEVLVLDEPANGLDPAGIRWMRQLLRRFADDGGTVLLSTHLLAEVEAIADRFVLVSRGRILADGPKSDLLGGSGTFVRATYLAECTKALDRAGLTWAPSDDGVIVDADPPEVASAVVPSARLEELRPVARAGLEDLFLRLTADEDRDGGSAA